MDFVSTAFLLDMLHSYGFFALFLVVMLESAGLPMPGESALITAAVYAASTHEISIGAVVATAAIAAIFGDNVGYSVGRKLGMTLLVRYGRRFWIDESRIRIGRYLLTLHGGKIVFFGRFFAFLRAFAALLAGAGGMPWPKFVLMNGLGGICWATTIGCVAYFFAEQTEWLAGPLGLALLAIVLVAAIPGLFFLRRYEKVLSRKAELAFAAPCHRA